MKQCIFLKAVIIVYLTGIHLVSSAQTYVFAQLTGTPLNTTGWNLQGSAQVGNITGTNNSELLLCPASNGKSGAVFFNQPINLSQCNKWKAEFDFRIFDGSGADGIAFCFLDVPPVGFVVGQGLGIPATANGLKICFDTWNNCDADYKKDMPKVEIRWGAGYNECWSQPTTANPDGSLSFIRSNNYNHALIEYNAGTITVSVNNKVIVSGFQTFTFSGYLGFTASTGGFNDNHSIKNVMIYTDMPPSVAGGGVSGSVAFCPNNRVQLGTANNANYVYSWEPTQGLSNAAISNPSIQLDNITDSTLSNKYYVKTAFANNPGCYSVDSVMVTVHPAPKINFITPVICLNDAIAQFTDSTYSKEASAYPFAYQWNFDDAANAGSSNPNTSPLQNPSHKYNKAAVYNVSLKVTAANACTGSLVKPFTVNGAVPKPGFTVLHPALLCSNDSVEIQDNSTVDFGSITKVEIFWDAINEPAISVVDNQPYAGKIYTHLYVRFQQPQNKSYLIRYLSYSGTACVHEISKTITLLASPDVSFTAIPSICSNALPRQIIEAKETGNMPGQFYYSGIGVSTTGLFNPQVSGVGGFNIQYKYVANNGCTDSALQTITVWPFPQVNAGPQLFVLEGSGAIINATASGTQLSYLWTPPVYLDNDTLLTPTTTPKQDTRYYVTATDIHSCSNTDSVFVKVLFVPQVPNAFTPNGDNINDTWIIKYLYDYPECIVRVFSRSGQQVFQSVGYSKPWDGTLNGTPLPIGTYYYIIEPKRGRKVISGSVTIIR